jgi:4-alpha-glucanotransferase
MLPVGPPGYGESPYSAQSAFAGNPLLLSLEGLAEDHLLEPTTIAPDEPLRRDRVEYPPMQSHRERCLRAAFHAFEARSESVRLLDRFCENNASWLDDFALFRALKRAHGGVQWTLWEAGVRKREPRALEAARKELSRAVAFEKFLQYAFDRQWSDLRAYAASRGIGLIGDFRRA